MQTFPPNSGGGSREQGYQTLGTPTGNVIKLNFCMTRVEVESHGCFFFLFYFQKTLADKL
jgi:hypothetical protein